MFQFLIGTVLPKKEKNILVDFSFQFLIGTVLQEKIKRRRILC